MEEAKTALKKAEELGVDTDHARVAVQDLLDGGEAEKEGDGKVAPQEHQEPQQVDINVPDENQGPEVEIIEDEWARVQRKFGEIFQLFNEYQYVNAQTGLVYGFTDESLKKFFSPKAVPEDVQHRFNTVASPNQNRNSKISEIFFSSYKFCFRWLSLLRYKHIGSMTSEGAPRKKSI